MRNHPCSRPAFGGVGVGALASGFSWGLGVACCRGLGQYALVAPLSGLTRCLLVCGCVGVGGVGGLVVNCIVDASIFDLCAHTHVFCCVCCFVCFFERSVDALASGADEGRGGLR